MDVKAEMTAAVREMAVMWGEKLLEQDALPFCMLALDSVGGMHVVRVPDTVMDKEEFVTHLTSFARKATMQLVAEEVERYNAGVRH